MRTTLAALLGALFLLALPAAAGAVTITEFPIEPGAAAGAHQPTRIRPAPDGNLWFVDRGTAANIGRISTAGERLPPLLATPPALPTDVLPRAISYIPTSLMGSFRRSLNGTGDDVQSTKAVTTIAEHQTGTVLYGMLDGTICVGISDMCARPYTLGVGEIVEGPDGAMWATYPQNDAVVGVSSNGTQLLVSTNVPMPVASGPEWLATGPDGNVWVTSFLANAVDRITPAGQRTRFALPPETFPSGITAGPDGALWIAGSGTSSILRVATNGTVTNVFPTPTPDAEPKGITAGPDGRIWFTENVAGRIGRITLDPVTAGNRGAPGGGTVGGAGGVVRDRVGPRLLRTPTFSPARVRAGRSTTLAVRLSEAADLKLTVARKGRGRRVGGRCVRSTARTRSRPACTRYVTATTLRRRGIAGTNTLTISARRLSAGTYRVTVDATDPAGNHARPTRVTLTVLRRR